MTRSRRLRIKNICLITRTLQKSTPLLILLKWSTILPPLSYRLRPSRIRAKCRTSKSTNSKMYMLTSKILVLTTHISRYSRTRWLSKTNCPNSSQIWTCWLTKSVQRAMRGAAMETSPTCKSPVGRIRIPAKARASRNFWKKKKKKWKGQSRSPQNQWHLAPFLGESMKPIRIDRRTSSNLCKVVVSLKV